MSQPIRYDSTETGAPVVNSVAASLNAMLLAVCVTGFNVKAITGITVASGVATVQCPTHGYACGFGQTVKISGASVAALNGNKQPTLVDANKFTFPAPGVADGSYTATDARRAPLGWEVAHASGDNSKIILRRTAAEASTSMLRLVDTLAAPASTTYAMASLVESASGVDTVKGETPTVDTQRVWMRGAANTTAKKWVVIGSGTRIWVMLQGSGSQAFVVPYLFGDPKPLFPGDAGRCFLVGFGSVSQTSSGGFCLSVPGSFLPSAVDAHLTFQRTLSGVTVGDKASLAGVGAWGTGLYAAGVSTPVPVVGDFYLKTATEIRARLPEMYLPQANAPFVDGQIYELDGRKLLAITISVSNTGVGQLMIDLALDWD